MKVTLNNNKTVLIGWKYGKCKKEVKSHSHDLTTEQDCTECFVKDAETKEEISKVAITRHFKDVPNKILARKTTFRLVIAQFSKADRKLLWEKFVETTRLN